MFDRIASLEDAPLPSAERGRWATFACLAVLAAVYAVEALASGGVLSIDGLTLLAMGAENRRLVVEGGELYRVFSAALLHANLEHVALNGLALGMAGWYLEPAVGWGWMLLLLGTGTVGGSVLSLTLNPPDMPSVGASSAIMAVFAAGMIAGLNRFPDSK